jgi:hypothetical protein
MSESKLLSIIPFIGDGQPSLMGGRTFSLTIRRMRCDLPFTIPYGVPPVRISHTITANVYTSAFMLYGSPHRHSGAMYLTQRRRETRGFGGYDRCRERTIPHIESNCRQRLASAFPRLTFRTNRHSGFRHRGLPVPDQSRTASLCKIEVVDKCMYGFVTHASEDKLRAHSSL